MSTIDRTVIVDAGLTGGRAVAKPIERGIRSRAVVDVDALRDSAVPIDDLAGAATSACRPPRRWRDDLELVRTLQRGSRAASRPPG